MFLILQLSAAFLPALHVEVIARLATAHQLGDYVDKQFQLRSRIHSRHYQE